MTEWLFGPDSMTWRINRESVLLLGGRGALLMQLAHPSVAAGVAQHSDFMADPLGRLRRTLDSMLGIIFGERSTAEALVARVNRIHAGVRGVADDGTVYDARDPTLLLWVYSTLVDSSLEVYERFVERLDESEVAAYYDETKVVGRMFGIPDAVIPDSIEGLRGWMDAMIETGEVAVGPEARRLAASIIRPLRVVPRKVAEASAVVTVSLLPEPIREGYGLRLGRSRSLVLALGSRASRTLVPRTPAIIRTFPAARAAQG